MNSDFHYYATFCASILAGYSNEEARRIAYSANFVDYCTFTLLKKCNAPISAATTQSPMELADIPSGVLALREITRIWASFHFLPGDLYAEVKYGWKNYKNKYRLICKPNSNLLLDTIDLAKNGSLEAIGISMHILADTWAHQYFAGTPSFVINDVPNSVVEIIDGKLCPINFSHNVIKEDDIENRHYINSLYNPSENSVMNLGHGRMGHLPDLCFIKYKYMPSWGQYEEYTKDNPSDYLKAFSQMVYALKCFKNGKKFELNKYDSLNKYKDKIILILNKRQASAENDWKKLAEEISGTSARDFNVDDYPDEYVKAINKDETLFSSFIIHALKQKSMITNRIYNSKNNLAGYSVEYKGRVLKGFKDYWKLIGHGIKGNKNE